MIRQTIHSILAGSTMALLAASPASAVIVADSLPFLGTPDWSDVTTGGAATIFVSGGVSILSTAAQHGTWFGWSSAQNPPSWSIADNDQGNLLSLSARFSIGADDWVAYLNDGTRGGEMQFNPTFCVPSTTNCYNFEGTPGVNLLFGDHSTFVPLDTSQFITYEMLLLGDEVIYRIGGMRYSGLALSQPNKFLLIGDRTGSSRSGTGEMFINAVSFDSATQLQDLPGAVIPEPASWAMLIAGFGLTGAAMRRRRRRIRAFSA